MSTPLTVFVGIALIILVSGLVRALNKWLSHRPVPQAAADEALQARLEEVEGRLRDVLDVMIALSEKVDRWEGAPQSDPPRRSATS